MSVEKRIEFFNWIRDIPYIIGLNGGTDYCCSTKAKYLANFLNGLGLDTREIICEFKWKDCLPEDILKLPYERDETHLFLQVYVPETQRWVNCDPTWDRLIQKLGFKIAEWDGLNDTILAVEPVEIYSPEKTIEVSKLHADPQGLKDHFEYHYDFYNAINNWMMKARAK